MLTEAQQWLLLLGLAVLQCVYVAWLVTRHRDRSRLDREYEDLCRSYGLDYS